MGLMKLSTYHKERGDFVDFYKGNIEKSVFDIASYDRVYITSLFTFYFDITIKTINHYKQFISDEKIYIGGILVTLMSQRIRQEIGEQVNLIEGLLVDSSQIGFLDNINIDTLHLDYSILDEIEYTYPAGDNYFAYTSRGCVMKCSFCAVPFLEPTFCVTNNIKNQVETIKSKYGEKANLLLLDNNILGFEEEQLNKIITDIKDLGFKRDAKFIDELPLFTFLRKINYLKPSSQAQANQINNLINYILTKKNVKMSGVYKGKYEEIYKLVESADNIISKLKIIKSNEKVLVEILSRYFKPKGRKRIVDFNQGIDARLITERKMQILSTINIEPYRFAFDDIKTKAKYTKAIKLAAKYDIKFFSTYVLYNFNDSPADFWQRLSLNIELSKELGIRIFSFPMKYAPVDRVDRTHIGTHWNRKFLQNLYAILNVNHGMVATGFDFFYRAYGKNELEFIELLTMPKKFVLFRNEHEANGNIQSWKNCYSKLNEQEKKELLLCLNENINFSNENIAAIMKFYTQEKKNEKL